MTPEEQAQTDFLMVFNFGEREQRHRLERVAQAVGVASPWELEEKASALAREADDLLRRAEEFDARADLARKDPHTRVEQ